MCSAPRRSRLRCSGAGAASERRAIGYRLQHDIEQQAVGLAVVVQRLVPAEAAGILYTTDRVSGQRDWVLISASWGLGEAVVGGSVTPDSLTVEKTSGRVLNRQTADKQMMTVRTASATEEQPVEGIASVRALESSKPAGERICCEPLARQLISPAFYLLGKLFVDRAEKKGPGVLEFLAARCRYIDDYLQACLETGLDQLVILGPGWTREPIALSSLRGA